MSKLSDGSESSPETSSAKPRDREQEAQLKLQELRELFSSRAWTLLCQELMSLYQWYGERMDQATSHDDMVRVQASRRLLKHLFSGALEQTAVAPFQLTTMVRPDYMERDAMEEPN